MRINLTKKDIISIAILDKSDIPIMLKKIPQERNIEINVSCPNTEKEMINEGLKDFITPKRKWCIIKISPHSTQKDIDMYYKTGFRQFHCCNTLPVKNGGLSGQSLIPYTKEKIEYIKKYPDCQIIAGGGIQSIQTYNFYKKLGSHHASISTIFFHPILFTKFYYNYVFHN